MLPTMSYVQAPMVPAQDQGCVFQQGFKHLTTRYSGAQVIIIVGSSFFSIRKTGLRTFCTLKDCVMNEVSAKLKDLRV